MLFTRHRHHAVHLPLFLSIVLLLCHQVQLVHAQDGPLTRWLSSLSIRIPPLSENTAIGTVGLSNVSCSNLSLQRVSSTFVAPLGYTVGVDGFGLQCNGNWAYDNVLHLFKGDGSLSLVVAPSSLSLSLALSQDSDGLVNGTSLTHCNADLNIGAIHIEGSGIDQWGVQILDALINALKKEIQAALDKLICPILQPLVANNITQLLESFNTLVRPFLKFPDSNIPPPPIPPAARKFPMNLTISDLTESDLIATLDYLLARVVGSSGPLGINTIVNLFTHQSGSIVINANTTLTLLSLFSELELHANSLLHEHSDSNSPVTTFTRNPSNHLVKMLSRVSSTPKASSSSSTALSSSLSSSTSVPSSPCSSSSLSSPSSTLPSLSMSSLLGSGVVIPINVPGLSVNMSLALDRISIDGLNTWAGFRLTQPIDPYTLLMDTKTDYLNLSLSFTIGITVPSQEQAPNNLIVGNGGAQTLIEAGTLSLNLTHSHFSAFLQLLSSSPLANSVSLHQLLGGGVDCLSSTFVGANMPKLYFSTIVESLTLSNQDPSSGAVEREIDQAVTDLVTLFTSSFGPAIPALFNGVVDSLVKSSINSLLVGIHNKTVADAKARDPALDPKVDPTGQQEFSTAVCPEPDDHSAAYMMAIDPLWSIGAFSAAVGLWILSSLILHYFVRRYRLRLRKSDAINTPAAARIMTANANLTASLLDNQPTAAHLSTNTSSSSSDSNGVVMEKHVGSRDRACSYANWGSSAGDESLASHVMVNSVWRYGIPLAILLNISLFISSNTSLGADVRVRIAYPGKEFWLYRLFAFALGDTVRDMWTAQVYALSLLIALLSGAWPYGKLVLMYMSWVAPRKWVSRRWRERGLMLLDAFGKYSLLDAYVMVAMMMAFRFNIAMPTPDKITSSYNSSMVYPTWVNASFTNSTPAYVPAAVDVFVEPDWGVYSFVLATIASLIITHLILHVHRQVAQSPTLLAMQRAEENDASDAPINASVLTDEKMALCNFVRRERGRRIGLSKLGKVSVVVLLVASIIMIIAGATVTSFAFEFAGAASLVLSEPKTNYSLLSLGWNLSNASEHPNFIGVRFLQVCYLLFAFVVPLAHMIVLIALWFVPLTLRSQDKMMSVVEVLNAWSAIEVFILSLFACIFQIRRFAAFIIGDKCNGFGFLLTALAPLLNGDDKCFDVIASLETGSWILFSAVLQYMVARFIVMRICHDAVTRRRQEHIKRFERALVSGVVDHDDDSSGADSSDSDDDDSHDGMCASMYKFMRAPFIVELQGSASRSQSHPSSVFASPSSTSNFQPSNSALTHHEEEQLQKSNSHSSPDSSPSTSFNASHSLNVQLPQ